jgi:lipoprotein-anchoring transpeptidase ErfK/SrfK
VTGPSVWRALASARTPKPKTGGSYIEISKSRQLLYEVRSGRVARIIHTSTGLTGNTPVGRFRIYRKDPGSNSLGMYQSLYFIGGFAIHGYVSVPTFPASHGCARIPMWLATGLFRRWPIGSVVRVLP